MSTAASGERRFIEGHVVSNARHAPANKNWQQTYPCYPLSVNDDGASASGIEDDSDAKLDIIWEPCDNPWGPSGFIEGDIVVYSGKPGIGDVETMMPSARYEWDPFTSCQRYQRSHHTPSEGVHALLLRRDVTSSIPWGFSVHRHEFGGACLVSSVDPLSPAGASVRMTHA